jgi:hypothetical protein
MSTGYVLDPIMGNGDFTTAKQDPRSTAKPDPRSATAKPDPRLGPNGDYVEVSIDQGQGNNLEPGTLNFYKAQNRPSIITWEIAKQKVDGRRVWKDNGIEVILQPVRHMPHEHKYNLFFFGPKTEYKENISGEYLFRPKAFNGEDDKEPSLKGHYNSNNVSLYPKLITSLNQAEEFTLQNELLQIPGDITREGKSIYISERKNGTNSEEGEIVKKLFKIYYQGPVLSIIWLVLLHKKEGKKLNEFTIRKGDQPMLTLGWSPQQARQYYEEKNVI